MSVAEIASTRLWLDDVRRPPSDAWVWAKTVAEAIETLSANAVVEASLDNDLLPFERDGLEVVEWMIDHRVFPRLVHIHTDNDIASRMMCGLLRQNGYRQAPGHRRIFIKKNDPS